jgi:hypothetical protein
MDEPVVVASAFGRIHCSCLGNKNAQLQRHGMSRTESIALMSRLATARSPSDETYGSDYESSKYE